MAAWRDLLESRAALPQGMSILLKAANVTEPRDGVVRVEVPVGPAFEKLNTDTVGTQRNCESVERAVGPNDQIEVAELARQHPTRLKHRGG
jgi:hypothetical protein